MQLMLRRSPERASGFENTIEGLNMLGSPGFHSWLTAQEIGHRFGVALPDITKITRWLVGHGFHVDGMLPNHMVNAKPSMGRRPIPPMTKCTKRAQPKACPLLFRRVTTQRPVATWRRLPPRTASVSADLPPAAKMLQWLAPISATPKLERPLTIGAVQTHPCTVPPNPMFSKYRGRFLRQRADGKLLQRLPASPMVKPATAIPVRISLIS